MNDAPVSRAEFTMLVQQVQDYNRRLEAIDAGGTRGVAVLQLQITDLAKDFAAHEQAHAILEARRVSGRRWAIALAVAAVAAIDGPMVTVLLSRRLWPGLPERRNRHATFDGGLVAARLLDAHAAVRGAGRGAAAGAVDGQACRDADGECHGGDDGVADGGHGGSLPGQRVGPRVVNPGGPPRSGNNRLRHGVRSQDSSPRDEFTAFTQHGVSEFNPDPLRRCYLPGHP